MQYANVLFFIDQAMNFAKRTLASSTFYWLPLLLLGYSSSLASQSYQTRCSIDRGSYSTCTVKESDSFLKGMPGSLTTVTSATGKKAEVFFNHNNYTRYIKNGLGTWSEANSTCSFDESGTFRNYSLDGIIVLSIRQECGD
jgi:hypothetical protein